MNRKDEEEPLGVLLLGALFELYELFMYVLTLGKRWDKLPWKIHRLASRDEVILTIKQRLKIIAWSIAIGIFGFSLIPVSFETAGVLMTISVLSILWNTMNIIYAKIAPQSQYDFSRGEYSYLQFGTIIDIVISLLTNFLAVEGVRESFNEAFSGSFDLGKVWFNVIVLFSELVIIYGVGIFITQFFGYYKHRGDAPYDKTED